MILDICTDDWVGAQYVRLWYSSFEAGASITMTVMSRLRETTVGGKVQGTLLIPEQRVDLGVIVAAGSSGRVDAGRAKLVASHGAVALALRFGTP